MRNVSANVNKVGEDNGVEVVVNVHLPNYYKRGHNHASVVMMVWIDKETGDLRVGYYTAGQNGRTVNADAFQYDPEQLNLDPAQRREK